MNLNFNFNFGNTQFGQCNGMGGANWAAPMMQLMAMQQMMRGNQVFGGGFSPQAQMMQMMQTMMMAAMANGMANCGNVPPRCCHHQMGGMPHQGWAFPNGGGCFPPNEGRGCLPFGDAWGQEEDDHDHDHHHDHGHDHGGPQPNPGPMPPFGGPRPRPRPEPWNGPAPGPRPGPFHGPGPDPFNGPRPNPRPCPAPKPNPNPGPNPFNGGIGGLLGGLRPPRPLTSEQWQTALRGNARANQAYQRMTPEQRAQVDRLAMNNPSQNGQANPDVMALLSNGTMAARDRQGQTTLQHLTTFSNQRTAQGLNREQGLRELMHTLADPGTIAQRNRGTCSPTSIEYSHARRQPADFARTMTGLFSESGQVRLANGETMTRNASGVAADDSNRSSIDRVYQSTMMDFGNGTADYNNATDTHSVRRGVRPTASGSYTSGSGLADVDAARARSAVFGEAHTATGLSTNGGISGIRRFTTDRDLQRELREGRQPQISMSWNPNPNAQHSSHAVVIERMDDNYVYLRNPWGNGDTGGNDGPPRTVVDAQRGIVRMTKDDFYARIQGTVTRQDDRSFVGRWYDRITE